MRERFVCGLAVLSLALLVGCNTRGTDGTGDEKGWFDLEGPANRPAEIQRGEDRTFQVTVERGGGFQGDVTLKVSVEPPDKGVTAEASPATVKAAERTSEVTVKAT